MKKVVKKKDCKLKKVNKAGLIGLIVSAGLVFSTGFCGLNALRCRAKEDRFMENFKQTEQYQIYVEQERNKAYAQYLNGEIDRDRLNYLLTKEPEVAELMYVLMNYGSKEEIDEYMQFSIDSFKNEAGAIASGVLAYVVTTATAGNIGKNGLIKKPKEEELEM